MAFCRSLKVQVHFKLAARSMLHGSACASHARGSTLQACRCVQEGSSRGRAGRPFSVRKWRFGVGNGSERRLRRGRSRPRGLVVTVSGDGAVFSMSASFGPPYSEHDPYFSLKSRAAAARTGFAYIAPISRG